jgi:sensor histidine kinase YesM
MKTRGYIDLYLPRKWAYHVKIILASGLIAILFRILAGQDIPNTGTVYLIALLFIQLELFLWLGYVFFSNIQYTTPKEYVRKAIFKLILFFMMAFFISIIIYVLTMMILFLVTGVELSLLIPHILQTESKGFLIGAGSGYLLGSMIFFYHQWIDALNREQKLKEEKLVFQYETLKNQVNPHFLFNSLNTLSSLVSRDVKLSEQYIHKLSSIYWYILENKDLDHVNLKKEVDFVKDYFYLQQVRDNGKIDLKINIKDPERFEILPISLQLLVENAFKHNIATREDPLKIVIDLNDKDETISVSNNLKPKTRIEESSNVGLTNLSERSKLITGRTVEIFRTKEEFKVNVPLKQRLNEGIDN